MHKYCVIKETQRMRSLLSLIKANCKFDYEEELLQEFSLGYIISRVDNYDIKLLLKSGWDDIELILGYEMRLLQVNFKKGIMSMLNKNPKNMFFIAKVRADESSKDIFDSIYRASSLKVELKDIKF